MVKKETIEILKILIKNNSERFTINQLAKLRNINYKSAYQAIEKLQTEGAITVEKKGNTKLCQFSKKNTLSTYIAEKDRLTEIVQDKTIKIIYEEFEKLNEQFIILLFGSYAKNKHTKKSDIDIMIISNNAEEISKKISWIPKNIDIQTFSYEEFLSMAKSREFSVGSEAIKNNVILYSIEDYYRLLDNVR